jgi:hypothetical protein
MDAIPLGQARYLRRRDAARYLSVSLRLFDCLAKAKKFPVIHVSKRRVVVDRIDLDQFLLTSKSEV